jgi:hypothetical protein
MRKQRPMSINRHLKHLKPGPLSVQIRVPLQGYYQPSLRLKIL